MNILFLSLLDMNGLDESNIYSDLIKEMINRGNFVDIISPIERRNKKVNDDIIGEGFRIIKPYIGNITNTAFVEKGISVLSFSRKIIKCIKSSIGSKRIDLFVVATPPVTLDVVVRYVKKKYGAGVYLLLKDIWPASMFDLKTTGGPIVKKIVCDVFRVWEKRLYLSSDYIGCMSQANVDYICSNNTYIDVKKVHINYNSIKPHEISPIDGTEIGKIREKYGIPKDKKVFIYGGTLGVGQNIQFLVDCLKESVDCNCHFVVSGKGVQYKLLEEYIRDYAPKNLTLINGLPKPEYNSLLQACDVGLVFIRYTAVTPNFPSRILTYMDYSLPILACTDPVSDLISFMEEKEFGWGCLSNDSKSFSELVKWIDHTDTYQYGVNARRCLETCFSAKLSCDIILNCFRN